MEIPKKENYKCYYDWVIAYDKLPFYGWFSDEEYNQRGASVWNTINNVEVQVTQVTRIDKPPNDNYTFVGLGRLAEYKRRTD